MSPEPGAPSKVLTQPRPGHADLPGMLKYGFDDARDVLERASARETAARVAAGTLAKLLLAHLGVVDRQPHRGAGRRPRPGRTAPGPGRPTSTRSTRARCAASTRRRRRPWSPRSRRRPRTVTRSAAWPRSSPTACPVGLGQPRALGPQARRPPGPGAHEHPGRQGGRDRRRLGQRRRAGARRPTTPSVYDEAEGYVRPTDRAGGIEGGISNGALLVARVAMKPLATLNRPVLETVDVVTKESTVSFQERTDVTAVPAMGVVAESMMALVLATEALRKFGGDSLAEVVRNRDGFLAALGATPSSAVGAAARPSARPDSAARHDPAHPARRDDGRRQDHDGTARGRRGWAGATGTPTPTSRRPPGSPCPSSSPATARRPSGEAEARGARRGLRRAPRRRWSRSPAARCSAPTTAGSSPPAASWCGCGPGPRRWPRRVGDGAGRPLLGDDPADGAGRTSTRCGARSTPRWPTSSSTSTSSPPPTVADRIVDAVDATPTVADATPPGLDSPVAAERETAVRALSVDLAERSYPVLVGPGARHEVARFVPPGARRPSS